MVCDVKTAVFPVGGLGTRFLPATKSMPKEMLPVVDRPVIHYAFDEAKAAGIERFVFVTGRNKTAIDNHFDHSYELESLLEEKGKERELALVRDWLPAPGNIAFTRQQEPLGLGHAVWCARHIVGNAPFAVLLPDELLYSPTPCLAEMLESYQRVPGSNMAAVVEIPREKTSSYGILDIEKEMPENGLIKAKGLVEKPAPEDAPSTLSIIGRYILQPEIFDILGSQKRGSGGEIQLTDAMNRMIETTDFFGQRFEGHRFDCGQRAGFIEANIALALERDDLRDRVLATIRKFTADDNE